MLLLASALGDTMDRLSQHTSSEPAASLSREELDQDYSEPSQEQDLDPELVRTGYKGQEKDASSSKPMELKVQYKGLGNYLSNLQPQIRNSWERKNNANKCFLQSLHLNCRDVLKMCCLVELILFNNTGYI